MGCGIETYSIKGLISVFLKKAVNIIRSEKTEHTQSTAVILIPLLQRWMKCAYYSQCHLNVMLQVHTTCPNMGMP